MELVILAQAAQPRGGGLISLLPMLLIMFIFYFLLIVPQRRQAKAHAQMTAELQKGDQVVTSGGLIGNIVALRDDAVTLKTGGSTVEVERRAIARRLSPAAPAGQPGA
ncbi:MAG TPA: preprotein translocase subunit YajC [Longimicrobiaceae bacterium]|nr:preprotein translocase subunit YajC [Longimicrobiaceae bacterium]